LPGYFICSSKESSYKLDSWTFHPTDTFDKRTLEKMDAVIAKVEDIKKKIFPSCIDDPDTEKESGYVGFSKKQQLPSGEVVNKCEIYYDNKTKEIRDMDVELAKQNATELIQYSKIAAGGHLISVFQTLDLSQCWQQVAVDETTGAKSYSEV
jgi:hypothetical protein